MMQQQQQPNLGENEEVREGRGRRQGQEARSAVPVGAGCIINAADRRRQPSGLPQSVRPPVRRPSEQKDISRSPAASSKRETESPSERGKRGREGD